MPLLRHDVIDPLFTPAVRPGAEPNDSPFLAPEDPSSRELLGAAFSSENTIGAVLSSERPSMIFDQTVDDPAFDPFATIEGTDFEVFAERFIYLDNEAEVEAEKRNISRSLQAKQTLAEGGAAGIGVSVLAGILDPVNLIPVGGNIYRGVKTGQTVLGIAARAAATGAASVALQEGGLQLFDAARTYEESLINITGGTILSGTLGAAAAQLAGAARMSELSKAVDADWQRVVRDEPDAVDKLNAGVAEDLSAAVSPRLSIEQEALAGAAGLEKGTQFLNPMLRLMNSPALASREFVQALAENSLFVRKNFEGIASDQAVETLANVHLGEFFRAKGDITGIYKDYRKAMKEAGEPVLKYQEFSRKIAEANRSGDISDNVHVQRAAERTRKFFEYFKKEAIAAKLLPEDMDVVGAESYFHRIYSKKALAAREPEFRAVVQSWVEKSTRQAMARMRQSFNGKIKAKQGELDLLLAVPKSKRGSTKTKAGIKSSSVDERIIALQKEIEDLKIEREVNMRSLFAEDGGSESGYVSNVTQGIIDKVRGIHTGQLPHDFVVAERGPMKERVLNIPDLYEHNGIKFSDFLENDIDYVMSRYARTMAVDIEMKKKFGNLDLSDQIKALNDEYTELAKKAEDESVRLSLDKRRKNDIADLEALRDIMRGHYDMPANPDNAWRKTSQLARLWNYTTYMGQVVLGSVPDAGKIVMLHGLNRFMVEGLTPLITNLKALKLSKIQTQLAGEALETHALSRMATMAEIGDPLGRGTAFERWTDNWSRRFSRYTLMSNWNDFWKGMAGTLTQNLIIDSAVKGASKKNMAHLASLGLNENMLKRIASQVEKHGSKDGSVWLAGSEEWTDKVAQRAYLAAVGKDVRRTIVTRTAGDVPLWMNTEIGRTIGQFKTFTFAAHQKTFLLALQKRDMAVLNGLITSVSLGMMVYFLKSLANGREISDDPAKWILEGIDRSGVLGVVMDVNNTWEKMGLPGIAAGLGQEPPSRYASRNAFGALFGPTFGRGEDMFQLVSGVGKGDLTEGDIRRMRRMIPFNNIMGFSQMFDQIEKEAKAKVR